MDTALQAVDTAMNRIRREVKIQKEKSDHMCKLKTAHNWQVGRYCNIQHIAGLFSDDF